MSGVWVRNPDDLSKAEAYEVTFEVKADAADPGLIQVWIDLRDEPSVPAIASLDLSPREARRLRRALVEATRRRTK